MEDKKYCVYKHTAPNGKVYIGITCQSPNRRWRNGEGYRKNKYFYRAIQKYGWGNFSHEILFENLLLSEASAMEIDLISKYKSNEVLYGYNISSGGENNPMADTTKEKLSVIAQQREIPHNKMELYMLDENLNIVKAFSSGIEAATYVGVKPQQIYDALHKLKNYTAGYYWCRKEDYFYFVENFVLHNNVIIKAVHKCDLQNNILETYESLREANRQTGVDRKSIKQCCENLRKTAGGYKWKYADKEENENGKDISCNGLS